MTTFPVAVERRGDAWFAAPQGERASARMVDWWAAGDDPPEGFRAMRGAVPPGAVGAPAASAALGAGERPIGVDQTNRSLIVGESVVVKWTTEPLVGPHPGSDRIRRLMAAGFPHMPAVVGLVEWRTPQGDWVPVVSASAFLPGAVDGWTWCLREARVALGVEAGSPRPFAADLGALAGAMHRALALPGGDVAAHGDFHVGQILRDSARRLYVIDFDGNPTLTPTERMAPRPAAYDVAGMLLSLENVGYVLRKYHPAVPDADVLAWTERVQGEFLAAYRALAADLLDETLLPALIDDQIAREFDYARRHLPSWQYVPEAALRRRGRR